MNKQLTSAEIRALSVAERLQLIEEIWDSLEDETNDLPMPDWHREALDKRLEAHARDPVAARPWEEVKADILKALGK